MRCVRPDRVKRIAKHSRRLPVGQHLNQVTTGQRLLRREIRKHSNAQPFLGGLAQTLAIVDSERSAYRHNTALAVSLSLSDWFKCPYGSTLPARVMQTSMGGQCGGIFRPPVPFEIGRAGHQNGPYGAQGPGDVVLRWR